MPAAPASLRAVLLASAARLDRAGVSFGHGTTNSVDEAAWLIANALGLAASDLGKHLDRRPTGEELKAVRALLARRIRTRKPAAYLIHEAWLGPNRFYVDERVIVPRSFIAELLRERPSPMPDKAARVHRALDLCTGSGCLAILAALAFPGAQVDASDISHEALAVAKRNIAAYRLGRRVRPVHSDLFERLAGRTYDVIVSNPPYVKAASMRRLPEEYRKEPVLALAGGTDGLEHTRRILVQAKPHLNPGGLLVVEIGHNRKALERAFPRLPFAWPQTSAGPGLVFALRRESLE